jgi:hypothetical protein
MSLDVDKGALFSRWFVKCGVCEGIQPLKPAYNRRSAKAIARDKGWEADTNQGWVCPRCIGQGKAKVRTLRAPAEDVFEETAADAGNPHAER